MRFLRGGRTGDEERHVAVNEQINFFVVEKDELFVDVIHGAVGVDGVASRLGLDFPFDAEQKGEAGGS